MLRFIGNLLQGIVLQVHIQICSTNEILGYQVLAFHLNKIVKEVSKNEKLKMTTENENERMEAIITRIRRFQDILVNKIHQEDTQQAVLSEPTLL